MVLYRINLVSLAEDIWYSDPGLLISFYVDNTEFNGSKMRSVQLMKVLLEWGAAQGYFPEPTKFLFIADFPI